MHKQSDQHVEASFSSKGRSFDVGGTSTFDGDLEIMAKESYISGGLTPSKERGIGEDFDFA